MDEFVCVEGFYSAQRRRACPTRSDGAEKQQARDSAAVAELLNRRY